jgi:glycerophosphoryl diester phosphodiesterase
VVIHDETVDRTSNGNGEVAAMTVEELKALDVGSWKGETFAGETIPTLEETVGLLSRMVRMNIELKAEDPRVAEAAIEALENPKLRPSTIAASFHLSHLRRIKERLPDVRTSLILDRELPDGFWDGDGAAVDSVAIHRDHVTAEIVAEMAERGKPVSVWTVDKPDCAVQMAAMGVEAITSNDPALILEALSEAGYRPKPPVW